MFRVACRALSRVRIPPPNAVAQRFQVSRPALSQRTRSFSSQPFKSALTTRVAELVPDWRKQLADVKKAHGDKNLGHITVGAALGGMRGLTCMVYETSLLDANEGIRFRGLTIPECQQRLPKAPGGEEPLPEGLFWLLLTGEVPNADQVKNLTEELHRRSTLPDHVVKLVQSYPRQMHPMTQLCSAVLALQTESKFYTAYQTNAVNKNIYWQPILDDSLDLIARLPQICALIYRNKYRGDSSLPAYNSKLDWAANFASMLGGEFHKKEFLELMRLYMTIHSDHEGGNVSAHATHLVGSALSDPYLSYCAGMAGLAGPLHGLANQEVLRWIMDFQKKIGGEKAAVTTEAISKACWDTLNAGHVIPGYGHAVLRKTDPRYMVQREFALKYLPKDPLVQLVSKLYEVVPDILTKHGKTKNPWPNVDAHSGVLLRHYKLVEEDYYTVLFGMSRALGVLSSLVIHRALGFPIERPKSVTIDWLSKHCHPSHAHGQAHSHS